MATMYYLFFGVLFTAVWSDMDDVHPIIASADVAMGADGPHSSLRSAVLDIAQKELGVREATGKNDGERVGEYLRYTHLGTGYAWCAAFVSFCYGQAGLPEPRTPWSPALFPNGRTYCRGGACRRLDVVTAIHVADVFGIYGQRAGRINHVGLVRKIEGSFLLTVEGNSNDRVESKRRHMSTVYAISDWMGDRR